MKTRGEIADAVARFLQDTSAARRVTILSDIDIAYDEALNTHIWPQLIRWSDTTISITQGQAYFHAPKDVRALLRIVDTTVPFVLEQFSTQTMLDTLSGYVEILGLSVFYTYVGNSGINTTLQEDTNLEIVSSGADARTGTIVGRRDGDQLTLNFTLNGINPVPLGPWDDVEMLYLNSSATNLFVNIRQVGTSTSLGSIGPNELRSTQRRYRLGALPAASTSLRLVYYYTYPGPLDEQYQYPIPIETYLFQEAVGMGLQQRRQWSPARDHFGKAQVSLLKAISLTEFGRTKIAKIGRSRRATVNTVIVNPGNVP